MKKISFLLLSLVFSFSVFSQIVNVEKKRKNSNGFQATIGIDFNIKETGNRIFELKNNIDLQYAQNAHKIILLNSIKMLNVDNGSLINNGFQHLRYNYTVKDSSFLTFEAFVQHQYNEQKLLKKRFLAGVGPRFRLIQNSTISCFFAPLAMYEYEELSDKINTETNLFRIDSYTNISISLSKLVSFNNITYFQPNFNNFNDYRISSETGLRFNINKHLAYSTSYAFDYDNLPPTEIQDTFWYFKNSLVLEF